MYSSSIFEFGLGPSGVSNGFANVNFITCNKAENNF